MLSIYNSLTQTKEVFKPIKANKVGLYVCGMTVYDFCHIGHARVLVAFDVITRYLRDQGFEVTYVRNITDIDDKIIKRAAENNEDFNELTQRFITAMHEDITALNVLDVDSEPRATQYIPKMIALVQTLIDKNAAYIGTQGDVYYDVSQFSNYGCLSHKHLDQLQAGIRVEVASDKKNPLDFVLWKQAKPNEPAWDSPWGQGRPGWHLECSVMSMDCLGEHFDIHGGGFDLQFPHHENEIAQSEAATDKKFVNTWMHVGFVQVDQEKMSKSLGNFFTIRDVLAKYPAEVVRFFLLSSHYRSPLNYSDQALDNAANALTRFYTALRDLPEGIEEETLARPFVDAFQQAMDDDFNTPEALAALFDCTRAINRWRQDDPAKAAALGLTLKRLSHTLGILQNDPQAFLQRSDVDESMIHSKIVERNEARANKNWALADKIRDELAAQGIVLEDKGSQTTWHHS